MHQNLSKAQQKRENRELKKKIDQKRKERNDQKLKFQKQERDREKAERFHKWQLEEIIQEQQKVLEEANIAGRFSNHFYSNQIHLANSSRLNYKRSHPAQNDESEIVMRPSNNSNPRKKISPVTNNLSSSQQVQVEVQVQQQEKPAQVVVQEKKEKEQARNKINETPKKDAFAIIMGLNQRRLYEQEVSKEDNPSQQELSPQKNDVSRPRSQFSDDQDQQFDGDYSQMEGEVSHPQNQSQNEPVLKQKQQQLFPQHFGGDNGSQTLGDTMRNMSQQTARFNDNFPVQQNGQPLPDVSQRNQLLTPMEQDSRPYLNKDDIDRMMMMWEEDSSDDSDYVGEQQQIYTIYSEDNSDHPKGYIACFPTKKPVYSTFSEKKRIEIQQSRDVTIPPHAHYLYHWGICVKMEELVKYNWKNLLSITFTDSQINNKGFKLFVDNYDKYPNIKILYLSYNPLTTVTADMLEKFEKLSYIFFGQKENACHLSTQSIAEVQKYENLHPDVQVVYYKKPEQTTDEKINMD